MSRNVPKLEAITLKQIEKLLKTEPTLMEYIQKTPTLKSTLQNTKHTIATKINEKILLNQTNIRYNLKRYAHIQLVQAIITLLFNDSEIGSIIELMFPYRLVKMSIWTELDEKQNIVSNVSLSKNGNEFKQYIFWKKQDLIDLLIDTFVAKMPNTISVFRSSISMSHQPVSKFIKKVHDNFGLVIPKKLINTYNKRSVQVSQYSVAPKTIF